MNTLTQRTFDDWADWIARHDEKKILDAVRPVLEKLAQMHTDENRHGNIQPKSLLVMGDDKIDLASFEACKTPIMDRSSVYAPPEAYDDPPSAPTIAGDVYAMAAVLYHAICGQPPIRASHRKDKQLEKLQMEIKPGAAVSQALEKGLALKCEDRPTTMAAFRDLLEAPNTAVVEESATTDRYTGEKAQQAYKGQVQSTQKESGAVAQPTAVSPRAATTPSPAARTAAPMPAVPGIKLVERLPVNLTVDKAFEINIIDKSLRAFFDPETLQEINGNSVSSILSMSKAAYRFAMRG